MKEIRQFIADDGTIFENRYSCEIYELKQKAKLAPPIRGFDYLGNIMEEITNESLYDCYFMLIEDKRQFEQLYLIKEQCGGTIPENNGLGLYIWINDEWFHIDNFTGFSLPAFFKVAKNIGLI